MDIIKYCKPENLKRSQQSHGFDYLLSLEHNENIFGFLKRRPIEKKAKIIALEGLNCCGKTTQKYMLESKIREAGFKVHVASITDTTCWDILSKTGDGTYYVSQPLEDTVMWATYFIDQFCNEKDQLMNNEYVIFDRYKDNFRYIQQAILEFHKIGFSKGWVEDLVSELPEPDYSIFLDIPLEEMEERYYKRGGRVGLGEKDLEITKIARQLFIRNSPKASQIDGTLSPQVISNKLYKIVTKN